MQDKINFKERISNIWKDAVWSKVISATIILIITAIVARFSNFSYEEIYFFIVNVLSYELPIFIFLSFFGIYFIIKLLITLLKKRSDPMLDEIVGNYKFRELYNILSSQNLNIRTNGMKWNNVYPPDESLLTVFHKYAIIFNKGLKIDDNLEDGGYLYGVAAPALVGYGLLDKIEPQDTEDEINAIQYQTSELGYRFFSLIEKTIHNGNDEKKNKLKVK